MASTAPATKEPSADTPEAKVLKEKDNGDVEGQVSDPEEDDDVEDEEEEEDDDDEDDYDEEGDEGDDDEDDEEDTGLGVLVSKDLIEDEEDENDVWQPKHKNATANRESDHAPGESDESPPAKRRKTSS